MSIEPADRAPVHEWTILFETMKPLLFILVMTGLGILVGLQFGTEVTWLNYYAGAMAGLLVGSVLLGYWSQRKRKKEDEQVRARQKKKW